ncbi:538_t:CDS:2 [Paraglomus brasilianum]|uniref:538_t:CDS:1 n=1 Tax=Paraglomus brasilianum TaxID=144538 RepID=A0A9N9GAC1_9GLOM|nr:538_t:CDS:2 [Paraglomus brasilianum]
MSNYKPATLLVTPSKASTIVVSASGLPAMSHNLPGRASLNIILSLDTQMASPP